MSSKFKVGEEYGKGEYIVTILGVDGTHIWCLDSNSHHFTSQAGWFQGYTKVKEADGSSVGGEDPGWDSHARLLKLEARLDSMESTT